MAEIVVGIASVNFQNDAGESIVGTTLYVNSDDDSRVKGMRADKLFVPASVVLPADLKPQSAVNIVYDRRGKVKGITLVK